MGRGRLDSILGSYSIPRVDNPSKNTRFQLSPSFYQNDWPANGRTVKEVETWSQEEVEHLRREPSEHLRRKQSEHLRRKPSEHLRRKPSEHLRRKPSEHLRRKPSEHRRRKPFDHYRRLSAVWQHSQRAVLNSVDSLFSLL